eukprot:Gb_39744 [translate_table: standard]
MNQGIQGIVCAHHPRKCTVHPLAPYAHNYSTEECHHVHVKDNIAAPKMDVLYTQSGQLYLLG